MIFGLFKKAKTPLEAFKAVLSEYQKLMETDEQEKGLLESIRIFYFRITGYRR
jgi:hypothetical protein